MRGYLWRSFGQAMGYLAVNLFHKSSVDLKFAIDLKTESYWCFEVNLSVFDEKKSSFIDMLCFLYLFDLM